MIARKTRRVTVQTIHVCHPQEISLQSSFLYNRPLQKVWLLYSHGDLNRSSRSFNIKTNDNYQMAPCSTGTTSELSRLSSWHRVVPKRAASFERRKGEVLRLIAFQLPPTGPLPPAPAGQLDGPGQLDVQDLTGSPCVLGAQWSLIDPPLPSWRVCFVGCLMSQQHTSGSQGRICSDYCTCCHTEIEVADQTLYLIQLQYIDTSSSADLVTSGAEPGTHLRANFKSWHDWAMV